LLLRDIYGNSRPALAPSRSVEPSPKAPFLHASTYIHADLSLLCVFLFSHVAPSLRLPDPAALCCTRRRPVFMPKSPLFHFPRKSVSLVWRPNGCVALLAHSLVEGIRLEPLQALFTPWHSVEVREVVFLPSVKARTSDSACYTISPQPLQPRFKTLSLRMYCLPTFLYNENGTFTSRLAFFPSPLSPVSLLVDRYATLSSTTHLTEKIPLLSLGHAALFQTSLPGHTFAFSLRWSFGGRIEI